MSDLDLDEDGGPGRPGAPVDIGRLLQDLLQRWRVIPVIAAVATVAGVIYAQQTVRAVYKAQTVMLYEGTKAREELITLVDSIKLPTNLEELRKRVPGLPPVKDLTDEIGVEFDPDSRLVVVRSQADGSKKVATLANTVVDVFLEYQARVARTQLQEQLRGVEAAIEAARVAAGNAQEQYDAFNKNVGVGDYADEQLRLQQQLLDTRNKAQAAGNAAAVAKKRAEELQASLGAQPKMTMQPGMVVDPNHQTLMAKRAQLGPLAARLAPDHVEVLRLKSEIRTLEGLVASGAGRSRAPGTAMPNPGYDSTKQALRTAKLNYEVELGREQDLKKLAARMQQQLNELSSKSPDAQVLLTQIKLNNKTVEDKQTERASLRAALVSPGEKFRIVTPATPPPKPDEITKAKTAVVFPVAAIALTLMGMIGWSLRGLRVHTAREAGYWANTPVVATSTWPRDQENMAALVDEFSDVAPHALGTTLVVAARPNEVPLAREVAYWLGAMTEAPKKALIGANAGASGSVVIPEAPDEQPVIELGPGAQPAAAAGGGDSFEGSTALVRTDTATDRGPVTLAQAWDGPTHGPALRRASRHADRVLVVLASATMSVAELAQLRTRLGRERGIGLLLVGLDPALERLPDRVGPVEAFWAFTGEAVAA